MKTIRFVMSVGLSLAAGLTLAGCWAGSERIDLGNGLSIDRGQTPIEGCLIAGDRVIFLYDEAHYPNFREPVTSVTVLGEFNHFDPFAQDWETKKGGSGIWFLNVPAARVPEGSKFEFLVNDWKRTLPPPGVGENHLLPTSGRNKILIVGQEPDNPWLERTEEGRYEDAKGNVLVYRLLKPKSYEKGAQYPLVIFLHGSGERGDDNRTPMRQRNGAYEFLQTVEDRSFFMLIPQCPRGDIWSSYSSMVPGYTEAMTIPMKLTFAIMDKVMAELPVDPRRIYVTGFSMGAVGTWEMVALKPKLFAAAVPVSGGHYSTLAPRTVPVPFWIFHGKNDAAVPVSESQKMVKVLADIGSAVKYTEYPDGDHFILGRVYSSPEMAEWLFAQKR